MRVGAVIITDGRRDLLIQTGETFQKFVDADEPAQWVCVDDSGNPEYGAWLDGYLGCALHHSERRGLAAAIRTAWANLDLDNLDYIVHLEDDLKFVRPLTIEEWVQPLIDDPNLAQICLLRGPQSPEEIAAGGILQLYWQTGEVMPTFGPVAEWTSHRQLFSLQPNIYPTWVAKHGWPEHGGEREFTDSLLAAYPKARFGYLGGIGTDPHYEHVGYGMRQAGWRV